MIEKYPEELKPLLQKRQLLLVGDITGKMQEVLSASIVYLNALGQEPITLFIDSTGGHTGFGLNIFDAVRLSKAPVHSVVTGLAYSSAFNILQACERRLAYPHAWLLFHAPDLGGIRTDEEQIEERIKERMEAHDEMIRFLARRSGQPIEQLEAWSRQERRFPAAEALKVGFLDETLELPSAPVKT